MIQAEMQEVGGSGNFGNFGRRQLIQHGSTPVGCGARCTVHIMTEGSTRYMYEMLSGSREQSGESTMQCIANRWYAPYDNAEGGSVRMRYPPAP